MEYSFLTSIGFKKVSYKEATKGHILDVFETGKQWIETKGNVFSGIFQHTKNPEIFLVIGCDWKIQLTCKSDADCFNRITLERHRKNGDQELEKAIVQMYVEKYT